MSPRTKRNIRLFLQVASAGDMSLKAKKNIRLYTLETTKLGYFTQAQKKH